MEAIYPLIFASYFCADKLINGLGLMLQCSLVECFHTLDDVKKNELLLNSLKHLA